MLKTFCYILTYAFRFRRKKSLKAVPESAVTALREAYQVDVLGFEELNHLVIVRVVPYLVHILEMYDSPLAVEDEN